jgi:hypothetical protein
MRPFRRLLPLLQAFLLISLAAFFAWASFGQAQTPTSQPPAQSSAPPSAAPSDQLPPDWSEAVRALAEKIAAALPAHSTLSLDVKNISSLTTSDATGIRQALRSELNRRGFRAASVTSAGTKIEVTLSEGVAGYAWVARWRDKEDEQVAIVAAPKMSGGGDDKTHNSLSLESKLVWQQPAKLLDFVLLPDANDSHSTFITLEPDRLIFHSSADSPQRSSTAVAIPHRKPLARDVRGTINVGGRTQVGDAQCKGDFEKPDGIICAPSDDMGSSVTEQRIKIPGHEDSESALLTERCGGRPITLVSGTGDWTQTDSIQGYVMSGAQGSASGMPIEFEGPVLAMHSEEKRNVARVIVRNLKTNNYEAYTVAAACDH